jgi:hypothetical protein
MWVVSTSYEDKLHISEQSGGAESVYGMQRECGMDFHFPEEIWLAGKGPSLDTYDWTKANDYRVGINEAALIIPKCWGAVSLDPRVLRRLEKELDSNVIVFVHDGTGPYNFKNIFYWNWSPTIVHCAGTLPLAIQIFAEQNVRVVHCVGCDSLNGDTKYAESITKINAEGHPSGYKKINEQMKDLLNSLNIEIVWEHV